MYNVNAQLRRAAEQAAQLPAYDEAAAAQIEREAREEERVIKKICDELKVVMHEVSYFTTSFLCTIQHSLLPFHDFHQVNPDGHCMYAAIADQLRILGILKPPNVNYAVMRAAAADYIARHPNDFLPFLPSSEGEDGRGASTGIMGPREFQLYCENVRASAMWGGQPELRALSRAFNVPIHVIQGTTPPIVVQNPDGDPDTPYDEKRVVRISYHRRMYGLGEASSFSPMFLYNLTRSL